MYDIRTTLVGSYPVPRWALAMPDASTLLDAMMVVVKTQELAGIDVLVDGELSRFDINHAETNGMIEYFLTPLEGISLHLEPRELRAFRAQPHMQFRNRPAGVVRGELGLGWLDLEDDFARFARLTNQSVKFTVTSPYMLAKTVFDTHYGSLQDLTMALAHILAESIRGIEADIIQVDEATLTGHPDDAAWAWEPINVVLQAVPKESALHLCFGNYGGQSIQRGLWQDLIAFFNRLEVDALILEFARHGYRELEELKAIKPDIALGIGVMDIKDLEIEAPDAVALRIEHAAHILGEERIRWVHPDCGFWMLPRNVADGKMKNLVAGRDLFYASPKPRGGIGDG